MEDAVHERPKGPHRKAEGSTTDSLERAWDTPIRIPLTNILVEEGKKALGHFSDFDQLWVRCPEENK